MRESERECSYTLFVSFLFLFLFLFLFQPMIKYNIFFSPVSFLYFIFFFEILKLDQKKNHTRQCHFQIVIYFNAFNSSLLCSFSQVKRVEYTCMCVIIYILQLFINISVTTIFTHPFIPTNPCTFDS